MEAATLETHADTAITSNDPTERESVQLDLTKRSLWFDGLCAQSFALARITSRTVSRIQLIRAANDIAEIQINVSRQGLFSSVIECQIALGETQELPFGGTLYLDRLDTTPKSMSARLIFTASP